MNGKEPLLCTTPVLQFLSIFIGASGRTHCVDTTIANILEGRVSYVPEKENNHTEMHDGVKMSSTPLSNEVIQ